MRKTHKAGKAGKSSRRTFLKTTAAAAAGTVLGACGTVEPKAQEEMPEPIKEKPAPGANERVNLGLIGPGGMGSEHIRRFVEFGTQGIENVRIVALSDVAVPRLESNLDYLKKEQEGDARGYQDYRELLDQKDIDCVLIATPEHWHAQMVIDALAAGKDVYVEKPMTLRLADALRVQEAAKKSKNIVQVGTQYMTYPRYQEARKLIADGAIGHPTFSQTSYCRNSLEGEWLYYAIDERIVPGPALDWDAWCGPLGTAEWDPQIYFRWRRYKKYSTGIIGDLLVHQMTPLMMSLDMGWPVRVTATGGHYIDKAMENHDQVNITVQFEKEHTMIVAGSTCNEYGLETMIRGHMGNLFLSGSELLLRPERLFEQEVDEQRMKFEGMDPHNTIRRDFLECVRTRKPPVSPVDHAVKVMVIVDLATRSMWEGKAFAFDPKAKTSWAI